MDSALSPLQPHLSNRFGVPAVLWRGLMALSSHTKARFFLYGGYLRDLAFGGAPRDIDILVHGDPREFRDKIRGALEPDVLVLSVLRAGPTNLHVGIESQELGGVYKLDFINIEAFLRGYGLPATGQPVDDARRVIEITDFTINAIAVEVADPPEIIEHARWREDMHNRVLRLSQPRVRWKDTHLVLRAVRLEHKLGAKIERSSELLLIEFTRGLAGNRDSMQKFYRYLLLSIQNRSSSASILDRLWCMGALDFLLPVRVSRSELELLCEEIHSNPALPTLGEDLKAPWIVAALLALQTPKTKERFLNLILEEDRSQLAVMDQILNQVGSTHFLSMLSKKPVLRSSARE